MEYPNVTIDSAFIEQYKANVIQLAQQTFSKIRPHITEEAGTGVAFNHERLAPTEALEKGSLAVTPPDPIEPSDSHRVASEDYFIDDVWDRRVTHPRTFVHLLTIEHEDKIKMLADPQSAYTINQAMAMARQYDDLIIEAATGPAKDGEGTDVPFPTSQVVGDGTDPISFDMITEVQELFMSNEIDIDIPKIMLVGPTQVRKLMQLTEQTSADYVRREALSKLSSNGIVPGWMGFTWLMTNRLLAPDTGQLGCLAFTSKALSLVVNDNMMSRIGENPSFLYMIQVFSQFTAGASRIIDEEIVHMIVADTL